MASDLRSSSDLANAQSPLAFALAQRAKAADPQHPPRLTLDEHAAAHVLGVSVYYLRKDRRTKRLIPFSRIGDRVVYRLERLQETVAALEEGGTPVRLRKARRDSEVA
jgi:hypothetical protein